MTRRFLDYVTPWLVDNPDDVDVSEVEADDGTLVLEVTVHPDDVGKIIGRRGRIIRSLRMLAKAAGQKQGTSVAVEVID